MEIVCKIFSVTPIHAQPYQVENQSGFHVLFVDQNNKDASTMSERIRGDKSYSIQRNRNWLVLRNAVSNINKSQTIKAKRCAERDGENPFCFVNGFRFA